MNRRSVLHMLLILGLLTAAQIACRTNRNPPVRTVVIDVTATPGSITSSTTPSATPLPDKLEAWLDEKHGLENFPVDAPLRFHFNQPMNTGGNRDPLHFSPAVCGEASWNEDNTVLTFLAEDGFSSGRSLPLPSMPASRAPVARLSMASSGGASSPSLRPKLAGARLAEKLLLSASRSFA